MEIDELPIAIGNFLNHRIHALKILASDRALNSKVAVVIQRGIVHIAQQNRTDGQLLLKVIEGIARLQSHCCSIELIHVADHCHRL